MAATIKHKLAYKKVLSGTKIKTAMLAVGYAKSTAASTGKLTRTKGWQELIDKHISEEKLANVHSEGLAATKHEAIIGDVPDYAVRHKYLETGYKVRGRLKEQPNGNTTNILAIFTDEQIRRAATRYLGDDAESETTPD